MNTLTVRTMVFAPVALLLVLAMPVAGAAGSNPRDTRRDLTYLNPPPVTDSAQIGAWLRQLAGRYRVEGSVWMLSRFFEFYYEGEKREVEFQQRFESAGGAGDCAAVGAGPGMHCIFNIAWQDQYETIMDPEQGPVGVHNLPGGVPYLNPSMLLVGLDPGKQGVSFLLVDNKGLPEAGTGSLAGDRATLRAPCVNAPKLFLVMNPAAKFNDRLPQACERIIRIDASPGAKFVRMDISIQLNDELFSITQLTLYPRPPGDETPARSGRRRR